MKKLAAAMIGAALLAISSSTLASEYAPAQAEFAPHHVTPSALDAGTVSRIAAVADSITTNWALNVGATEMNPLISTSPMGLTLLAGIKIGLIEWAERSESLNEEEKNSIMKTMAGIWSAVSVNNILIALSASNPASIAGGIIAGIIAYRMSERTPAEKGASATAITPPDESADLPLNRDPSLYVSP